MPQSAKSLFTAMRRKVGSMQDTVLPIDLPDGRRPDIDLRDPLDYDPTPPDATAAFLAAEAGHMRHHGARVWEAAVGGGHMARVLASAGFTVIASDVVDRGHPGTILRSFYDWDAPPAPILFTNPPYCEINARDGHCAWLRYALSLGLDYIALLLNADWPAARINGMDLVLEDFPPSIEYLCCWKIDFRGAGAPPQRNSWFVWDTARPAVARNTWLRTRLYRDINPDQGVLL